MDKRRDRCSKGGVDRWIYELMDLKTNDLRAGLAQGNVGACMQL